MLDTEMTKYDYELKIRDNKGLFVNFNFDESKYFVMNIGNGCYLHYDSDKKSPSELIDEQIKIIQDRLHLEVKSWKKMKYILAKTNNLQTIKESIKLEEL